MLFIVLKCTSLNLGGIGYLRNFVLIEVISYLLKPKKFKSYQKEYSLFYPGTNS